MTFFNSLHANIALFFYFFVLCFFLSVKPVLQLQALARRLLESLSSHVVPVALMDLFVAEHAVDHPELSARIIIYFILF